jgi:acetyltransferase-like isoleucine patch superfamily enzyme
MKLVSQDWYITSYRALLKSYGMHVEPDHNGYIDPSAFFDNYDYSLITIGQHVTISRDVLILNHDFSISQGLQAAKLGEIGFFLKEVIIGDNCFIGAKAILLPGTFIGENTIIGAGAVVKGNIPQNSVVVGNPAKVIDKTTDFGFRHREIMDFIEVQ